MNRFILTILFALCIFEYAKAATVPEALTDLKKLKNEVVATMNILQSYIDSRSTEITNAQDNIQNEFKVELNKEVSAALDKIKDASVPDQCIKTAKVKLDSLKVTSPKIVQECIDREEKVELNGLFNKLLDAALAGQKILELIEILEKEASSGKINENIIADVKETADLIKDTVDDLSKSGDKIIETAKSQSKDCSNKQLVDVQSVIANLLKNPCV